MDKKKVYELLFDGKYNDLNEYVKGRISGAISALTGSDHDWVVEADGRDNLIQFEATNQEYLAVLGWINTWYPTPFMGVREVE